MIRLFIFLSIFFCSSLLFGQKEILIEKGTVTYVSSQNVYVKFYTTANINNGDTLYYKKLEQLIPSLIVKFKSTTSCICSSLLFEKIKIADEFYSKSLVDKKTEKTNHKKPKDILNERQDSIISPQPLVSIPSLKDKEEVAIKERIIGRISAASYSNFYGNDITHRMRYTLSFQGSNIHKSRFSSECYLSFRHTIGQWQEVKDHFSDALKVYSLSVKYDLNKTTQFSFGRKINQHISSMGAIDGLQIEKAAGHFIFGALLGSRPDFADYGINLKLFQTGGFISHATRNKDKSQESTLAFVEQRNQSKTDRRFIYFQHSNTLLKNLSLFSSFEVDLFQNINGVTTNNPSLTSLLVSCRYKFSKKFDISFAYDDRKNIIYYESYKNYIDQLIEDETRQGLRFGANYRFSNIISWGFNLSWRFQKSNINLSKNLNTYLNISRIPGLEASASLSANILQTSYLDSKLYGFQLSKEIFQGKLSSELYFRMVEYNYKNYENKIQQQITGIDISWNITRKLAFYIYYEGTFDKQNTTFNSLNSKIIQRF